MAVLVSVRIPENLNKRIKALARALDRPKSYIFRKALETYLDEYADYLIALERLKNKRDEVISSKTLREELGLSNKIQKVGRKRS